MILPTYLQLIFNEKAKKSEVYSLYKNLLDLPVQLLKCDETWLPDYHYLCGTYFPKGQYKFTVELVTTYYVGSPEARGRLGTSVTKWLIFGH